MVDLVGIQQIRWDKGGVEPAGDYAFFYGRGSADHRIGTDFLVYKWVEFVSDR
jgi:hypothetical protein